MTNVRILFISAVLFPISVLGGPVDYICPFSNEVNLCSVPEIPCWSSLADLRESDRVMVLELPTDPPVPIDEWRFVEFNGNKGYIPRDKICSN